MSVKTQAATMSLYEAIRIRRSVRGYLDTPVPQDVLHPGLVNERYRHAALAPLLRECPIIASAQLEDFGEGQTNVKWRVFG